MHYQLLGTSQQLFSVIVPLFSRINTAHVAQPLRPCFAMDESWRVSIGSVLPRRRSTEESRGRRGLWEHPSGCAGAPLGPDDFRDVFGGPPRSVLLRRFSGELHDPTDPRRGPVFDEIFRTVDRPRGIPRLAAHGRGQTALGTRQRARMVRTEEGFYDDIFGSEGGGSERRSRSKSKSSSSVLSSEDVSPPIRAASSTAEDSMLSSFVSKLRPITIPSKRYLSSPSTISRDERNSQRTLSTDPYPSDSYFLEPKDKDWKSKGHGSSELLRQRSHLGFSCCFSPPETISLEASFRRYHDEPAGCDNSDVDSPSSVISVLVDPMLTISERENGYVVHETQWQRKAAGSSYMMEISSHSMQDKEGAAAIDEAIAWAKQKFWNPKGVDVKDEQLHSMDEIKE